MTPLEFREQIGTLQGYLASAMRRHVIEQPPTQPSRGAHLVVVGKSLACSECGGRLSKTILYYCPLNFCPWCGSRLEAECSSLHR